MALLAALLMSSCGGSAPTAAEPRTRVYAVVLADQEALPATHECVAEDGRVVAATRFLQGDLTLFPEGAFRWRYQVEHRAGSGSGARHQWVDLTGVYSVRDDTLQFRDTHAGTVVRTGTFVAEGVSLTEALPCPPPAAGLVHHADLLLMEP